MTNRHIGGEMTVNPSGGAVTRICSSSVMDESKCGKKGGKGGGGGGAKVAKVSGQPRGFARVLALRS